MVATTNVTQDGEPDSPPQVTTNHALTNGTNGICTNNMLQALVKGKYTMVGIDIDTTGRRLIDEIVQLAAYTPTDHFEQYIMPYMNLNPAARQRHQVRVISIGFYRMLKSMQTYKIIKSKSEIAALKDFLDWLEALKVKDANSLGIILVYHEERKFIPYMILESLKKYNLLDRFLDTVKSFANGLNLAKASANESLQHFTLRKLSKVLAHKVNNVGSNTNVSSTTGADTQNAQNQTRKRSPTHDREFFDGNASVRAKLAYEVALLFSNQDQKVALDSNDAMEKMINSLQPYAYPIEIDLNELQTQNENLERQNSFRPVFLNYFKTTLYHRVRAVKFRIVLAEHGYDLPRLNNIWNEKQKDGLAAVFNEIEGLKSEDKAELADLFDSYFDPGKVTIKPVVKNNSRRRNRRGVRNNNMKNGSEQGAGGDKQVPAGQQIPDSTTTKAPAQNGGGQPQRKRFQRSRNNSVKSQAKTVVETPVNAPATN